METTRRIWSTTLLLAAACLAVPAGAMAQATGAREPLIIQDQGSFAVGGTMLTRIPIVIYFGDNIPEQPTSSPGVDNWRTRLAMARLWRDAVNRHGSDVTLVHLPDIGICGNTHFAFSDLNNVEIADLMSKFLKDKGLD